MSSGYAAKVALVTGANKGIGYCIVDGLARARPHLTILLGARDLAKGQEAARKLAHPNVHPLRIDIDDESSIEAAVKEVKEKYGGLDILLNNAGMAFKGDAFDENVVKTTYKTNYYGTLHCIQKFLPIINSKGKVINVSSGSSVAALRNMSEENKKKFLDDIITLDGLTTLLEQFRADVASGTWKERGWPNSAYGMSKVGVSILTRVLAKQTKDGITINSGCPGWCRTDMAGDKASRSAEEGAKNFIDMCLIEPDQMPNGEFFEDSKVSSLTRPPSGN